MPKASVRCSATLYPSEAIRAGSSRIPWRDDPERRSHEVADQHVDDDGDAEGDVVQPLPVVDDVADEPRRVAVDAGDRREAAHLRDLADEQERDHRVGEGEHEEVDPEAP